MADPQVTTRRVFRVTLGSSELLDDALAVESALEIRIDGRALATTLRTPGHDRELVLGFLASERVIQRPADVRGIVERAARCADEPDIAEVTLAAGTTVEWSRLERNFASTSACGLCGRAHLDSLRAGLAQVDASFRVRTSDLLAWGERARAEQAAFARTGGLHAAAFAGDGRLAELVREDVGRHNAVDKVVGGLFELGRLPLRGGVLWVSGRAGAEIVLKAARAGIPVLAAVGAPSSMAVELAIAARMTLVGFLREERMNVYSGAERLEPPVKESSA